jgi:hypothetical protein
MDGAPLPDLDALDRDALLDLIRAHEQQHASLITAYDEEIRRLEAELDAQRQTLSEQAGELDSRREHIEHLRLMVEKFRHMLFGKKSEKLVVKLEQMEFELEEDETTQAEAEAIAERIAPRKQGQSRPERKPLPEHLKREGRYGHRLYELARGIDENPVVPNRPTQSISAEDTFEQDVLLAETEPMIRRLAEKTWEASCKESRIARTVVLKLKTAQFQVLTRSETPFSPPASSEELTQIALSLRDKVNLDPRHRFRLVGISLGNFRDPGEDTESSLFG